jgi:phosphate-selective porin OprO/OprP
MLSASRSRRLAPPAALTAAGTLLLPLLSASGARAQALEPPAAAASDNGRDVDARLRAAEETIRQLQESLRRLQEERDAAKPAGAPAAPAPLPPAAASQDRFVLQSPGGDFRLRLRGYAQSDARFFTGRGGDTGNSTFYLRRVRPILDGTIYKNIDFRIMPDFGEGRTVLQDSYLDLKYRPQAQIRAGKFKEPLSLERLQSGTDRLFVERSIANNLAPDRYVGLQLFGDLSGGTVSYALGVFNGVPDGGSSDGDAGDDKDIAARILVQPFRNRAASPLQGLGVGLGATTGRQPESLSGLTFRTGGRSAFFRYDPAVNGSGRHTRLAP